MEWLLSRSDDLSLDDDFTEEEGQAMKQEIEQKKEEEVKVPLTEEEKKEKLAKLEELRVKKRAEREAREKVEAKEKEKVITLVTWLLYQAYNFLLPFLLLTARPQARIDSGKDMTEIREALAEQEIRKLAELKRSA